MSGEGDRDLELPPISYVWQNAGPKAEAREMGNS